ncbi:MAG: DUF1003 domain-containing protein [Fibrobacteria bacterium]
MQPKDPLTCAVCNRLFPRRACASIPALRPSLKARLAKAHPGCDAEGWICMEDLNKVRTGVVEALLASGTGEMTRVEAEVVESIRREELLTRKLMDEEEDAPITFGQHMADKVASFGGSWSFLMAFAGFLSVWILLNAALALFFRGRAFDPYPFILLNLILSCLASVQAPIIMMSQNRKEARDRKRAENDYKVNLKAELEIRGLKEKMDHLLDHQWQYLMEIQQIQVDLMEEIARRKH